MVRVLGPLFSRDAAGPLANQLIFRKAGRAHTCYPYFKPVQPASDAQTDWQDFFSQLAATWSGFTEEQKAEWNAAAIAAKITPYNAYLSAKLLIGPAPPVCPPEAITGHIEAGSGFFSFPNGYSSDYTADPIEPESLQFEDDTGPGNPHHELTIILDSDTDLLTIELNLYDENGNHWLWANNAFPFTWCTSNELTCDEWTQVPFGSSGCTMTLLW